MLILILLSVALMVGMVVLSTGVIVECLLLPLRILGGLFRAGHGLAVLVIFGLLSLGSGIVTGLFGLLKGLLPWILIAVGIGMIVRANRTHPEVRKEAFDSFYAHRRT